MRKNNLFKKAIAVITAVCTLVSATGFNGVTAKAVSITTISVFISSFFISKKGWFSFEICYKI